MQGRLTDLVIAAKKRPRSSNISTSSNKVIETKVAEDVKDEEESDDEPVTKRPRRNGVKTEAEDSIAPATTTTVQKKHSTGAQKSRSMAPPPKPVKEEEDGVDEEDSVIPRKVGASASVTEDSASEVEDGVEEDEEDEKPEVAAKAREKVQTTLQSKDKDPYPDWKPGEPVPYAALCTTFSLIEMTTKRLIIAAHCSLFLRQVLRLTPDDLLPTV